MKLRPGKLGQLMAMAGAGIADMPRLTGCSMNEIKNAISFGYADPEVIGKFAAFFGCTVKTLAHRTRANRREPLPYSAVIDGYEIECAMAEEDISYEDLKETLGFECAGFVKQGSMKLDKLVRMASALYREPEKFIVFLPEKDEADPAGTESTSRKNIA